MYMELKDKKIDLFGTVYKIKIVDSIELEGPEGKEYTLGLTDYNNCIISVASKIHGIDIPKNEMEITLLHELTHAILMTGQYKEESANEPLVEWIARCINQLLKKNII